MALIIINGIPWIYGDVITYPCRSPDAGLEIFSINNSETWDEERYIGWWQTSLNTLNCRPRPEDTYPSIPSWTRDRTSDLLVHPTSIC